MSETKAEETGTKISRPELFAMLNDIIVEHSETPARQVVAMGEAMVAVGRVLEGVSIPDARAALRAVAEMHGMGSLISRGETDD